MKTLSALRSFFILLAGLTGIETAPGQPVITSFTQNGVLVCGNLQPGSQASVQWASSLNGPWQSDWSSLTAINVGASGAIQVSVPMYFRVLGVANPPTTTDGMALISAGSYTMGDTLDGESDAFPLSVTISGFYMDTNLVSYGLWTTVSAYAAGQGYSFDIGAAGKNNDATQPVQTVDWYDCVKWCNARSQQAGLTPVYYTDAGFTQVYKTEDTDNVYPNWAANGYRLPTEAEWEKAARGGLSGQRFPWGLTLSESQANYDSDAVNSYDLGPIGYNAAFDTGNFPYTSPVGSFAPNAYGLYDMAGNLWEWCWDWYGTPYGQPTTTNPTGPSGPGSRVLRGGNWNTDAGGVRCACRVSYNPSLSRYYFGFRCVRAL